MKRKTKKFATLNLTALVDVMTILIVFLIYHSSFTEETVKPTKGLSLVQTENAAKIESSEVVSLSLSQVTYNGKVIANLSQGKFPETASYKDDKKIIYPVLQFMSTIANQSEDKRVLILADKSLPTYTVEKLIYTLAMSGFDSFELGSSNVQ